MLWRMLFKPFSQILDQLIEPGARSRGWTWMLLNINLCRPFFLCCIYVQFNWGDRKLQRPHTFSMAKGKYLCLNCHFISLHFKFNLFEWLRTHKAWRAAQRSWKCVTFKSKLEKIQIMFIILLLFSALHISSYVWSNMFGLGWPYDQIP